MAKIWRPGVAAFALVWLVVLCVPSLRLMLRVQTLGSEMSLTQYPWTARFRSEEFSAQRIADAHPNDVRALAKAAENRAFVAVESEYGTTLVFQNGHAKEVTAGYDRLIQRFPNQAWLIANRLRHTTRWLHDNRLAGEIENFSRTDFSTPAPETRKEPPNFTPAELNAAIAIARRGQRLEPDNSFFDWMLAILLWAGYRDDEALRVVQRGSLKPRYDDHSYDDLQATIAARELVRPLLLEEKIALSSAIASPQHARFREFARDVAWQAVKAERAGDHARALQLRGDLARLCAPMMKGRNSFITGLVARACQQVAWDNGWPARNFRRTVISPGTGAVTIYKAVEDPRGLRALGFSAYAKLHGRPDLAREEARLSWAGAQYMWAVQRSWSKAPPFGISAGTANAVEAWWVLGLAALAQIGLVLLLCGGLWLLSAKMHAEAVRPRDLCMSVVAGAVVMVVAAAVALRLEAGSLLLSRWGWFSRGTNVGNAVTGLILFLLSPVFASAIVPWAVTLWWIRHDRKELRSTKSDRVEHDGSERNATPVFAAPPHHAASVTPPPIQSQTVTAAASPRDLIPLAISLYVWSVVATALACWVAAVAAWQTQGANWTLPLPPLPPAEWPLLARPASALTILAVLLTALCYIGWLARWRWATPLPLRRAPIMRYAGTAKRWACC